MRELCSVLFLILFSASAVCDVCITFDFENGLQGNFTNDGICNLLPMWIEGTFADLPMESPHIKSNHFIAPTYSLSCINSFVIQMTSKGVLEVNVYMESYNTWDQITVLVQEMVIDNNDIVIGLFTLTPTSPDFFNGWHTLRIPTPDSDSFSGYVTFMGVQGPGSIVIVDSFRYFTYPTDQDWCQIYQDDILTTQPAISDTTTEVIVTTEPTPDPITESVVTTETTLEATTETVVITETTAEFTADTTAVTDTTTEFTTEEVITKETTHGPTTEIVLITQTTTDPITEPAITSTTDMTPETTNEPVVTTASIPEPTIETVVTIETTPEFTTGTVTTAGTSTVTISEPTEEAQTDTTVVTEPTTNISSATTEAVPETTTEPAVTPDSIPTESEPTTPSEIITTINIPDVECNDNSFWTPLTITLIVLLPLLILITSAILFYQIRKRSAKRKTPHLFTDVKDLS